MELALAEPRTVVLAGDPHTAGFQAMVAVAHGALGPRRALLCADGGAGQEWLAVRRPYLAGMKPGFSTCNIGINADKGKIGPNCAFELLKLGLINSRWWHNQCCA